MFLFAYSNFYILPYINYISIADKFLTKEFVKFDHFYFICTKKMDYLLLMLKPLEEMQLYLDSHRYRKGELTVKDDVC